MRTGLISELSTNLIKVLCEVAIGKRKKFKINGNNYNTKDGTPIRDFIRFWSSRNSFFRKYLLKNNKSQIFNCGYGKGYSVLDVLKNMNFYLTKKYLLSLVKKDPMT